VWNYRRGEVPPVLQLGHNEPPTPILECTRHMCPIQVHWHVKQSYREYWRVKMTIRNLNLVRNYSQWNLVVLHPNLRSITQVFSFDYMPLDQYGDISKLYQCISFILYMPKHKLSWVRLYESILFLCRRHWDVLWD